MLGVATKRFQIGSRVRIAAGAALFDAAVGFQPEPGQMLWAGRESIVTGYRRSADDRPLFALRGAPGFWSEEWIDPI